MNQVDYSQIPLRDIHLPGPIGFWPPAPGWWVVAGLVVAALVLIGLRYRGHYRERAALRAFRTIQAALEKGASPATCIQRISMTLRRFAMSVGGAAPVAGLTGDRWLRFLDSRWGRDAFCEGDGRLLIFGPYAPPGRVGVEQVTTLNRLCIEWVRAQRPER